MQEYKNKLKQRVPPFDANGYKAIAHDTKRRFKGINQNCNKSHNFRVSIRLEVDYGITIDYRGKI